MKIRFIPAGVTLLAGAITCLICLMRDYDPTYSLEVLLIVLIIFTAIGMKAQKIIMNVMHQQKMQEEEMVRLAEFKEAERIRKLKEENQNEDGDAEEMGQEQQEQENEQETE